MPNKITGEIWPWALDLNTGLPVIDDEHQQLLQLIYQAHLLAEQGVSTT